MPLISPSNRRGPLARLFSTALLTFVLAACGQSDVTTDTQTDPPTPPADAPKALFYGEVSSPITDELEQFVSIEQYDGSQDAADYDLIVADGDSLSPETMKGDDLIVAALRASKRVLVLDASEAHKRDALGYHLGFASYETSPAYLVRRMFDENGQPTVSVTEYPTEGTKVPSETILVDDTATEFSRFAPTMMPDDTTVDARTNPAATALFVGEVVEQLASEGVRPAQTIGAAPDIPAGLQYATFIYYSPTTFTTDVAFNGGTQQAFASSNYTIRVLLDNENNPQGNFQYVVVELDGVGNPTNGKGNFAQDSNTVKAWYQSVFQAKYSPVDDTLFTPVASSPETTNNVTQLTSGVSFAVGFSGKDPGESFTYNDSKTENLSDWLVKNQSAGNAVDWVYANANTSPFNFQGYPNQPNDLATNQLQLHTSAAWKTEKLLSGPAGMVEFTYWNGYSLADIFCSKDGGFLGCLGQKGVTGDDTTWSGTLAVDLSAVVPVSIKSLTFDPNPVSAGTTVKGTITLSSAAPTDVTIPLSSNSQNATVLPSVLIPKGSTSASFDVQTSANGVPAGGSTTATVTALYAQSVQTQLTIKN